MFSPSVTHLEPEVDGIDLVNLALFQLVLPKAYIGEVRAYLHNKNPVNPPFSKLQIHRVEARLGLWQKVESSSSEAYRTENIFKRNRYWGEPYLRGVNDQDTASMIDIDEVGF